jgi:hypothetical protein
MTPAQQSALAGLVGRALTAGEVSAIEPHLSVRNDVAIASILSTGRAVLIPRTITARGVRAAVPIVAAVRFLQLLRDLEGLAEAPAWLTAILTAMSVPEADRFAYLDTLGCAHAWLQQEAGIDLGSPTTRGMLDLLAASNPALYGTTVVTLKSLAERPDPILFPQVSDVLNKAEGRVTL